MFFTFDNVGPFIRCRKVLKTFTQSSLHWLSGCVKKRSSGTLQNNERKTAPARLVGHNVVSNFHHLLNLICLVPVFVCQDSINAYFVVNMIKQTVFMVLFIVDFYEYCM